MLQLRGADVACLALVSVFAVQVCAKDAAFFEDFSSGWDSRWIQSSDAKYNGKFAAESPKSLDDQALKVPVKARHYGISTRLPETVQPSKGLALQYELKLSEGLTCGGAYLKFVTDSKEFDPSSLKEATPYTIMFGADKCGSTNKVHFILRHKKPNGDIEEKHLESPPAVPLDKLTHVYTAIVDTDNSYQILIDGEEKKTGSLFEDFSPPINPAKEIDDPEDTKPEDWVDTAKIADPEASKPDDWDEDAPKEILDEEAEKPEGWLDDEPEEVDDPEAEQPDDWDEEEDGEWEPPRIANPKCEAAPGCGEWERPSKINPAYKGTWYPPMIDNPEYKGVWKPRKIANPDYFEDKEPLKNLGPIGAVAVEIWTMDQGYYFDNVLVTNDAEKAKEYREKYWQPKHEIEQKLAEEEVPETEDSEHSQGKTTGNVISRLVEKVLSVPGISLLKPSLGSLVPVLAGSLLTALAVVGIPLALLLALLFSTLFGGKKASSVVPPQKKRTPTVVESKKEDVTGADDAPVSVAQPVSVSVPPPGIATTAEPGDGPARRTRTATAVTAEPTTIS
ncbi:hypothetical protein ABBQ32_012105 [Trebouxia sp. C0010 RCD-2024]